MRSYDDLKRNIEIVDFVRKNLGVTSSGGCGQQEFKNLSNNFYMTGKLFNDSFGKG